MRDGRPSLARFFRSDALVSKSGDISRDSNISRDDDETFDFRDVLLRSRCRPRTWWAPSRARREGRRRGGATLALVDALVWQGGEPAYEKPAEEEPAEEENSEENPLAARGVRARARSARSSPILSVAARRADGDDALVFDATSARAGIASREWARARRRRVVARAAGDATPPRCAR